MVQQQLQWEQMGTNVLAQAGNRRRSIRMSGSATHALLEKVQTSATIAGTGRRELIAIPVISLVLTEHAFGDTPSLGRRSLLPENPMVEALHRHREAKVEAKEVAMVVAKVEVTPKESESLKPITSDSMKNFGKECCRHQCRG